MRVHFKWSQPLLINWPEGAPALPRTVVMTHVPRVGEHLLLGDVEAGTVRQVTWDLGGADVYLYVEA